MGKKNIFIFNVFFLFSVFLHCQFVDLGDDPDKIIITSIIKLDIPEGLEFHSWSPKGSYFAFFSHEVQKTYIFKKDGRLLKICDGKLLDWSRDEKKILCRTVFYWIHSLDSNNLKRIERIKNDHGIQFGEEGNLVYFSSYNEEQNIINSIQSFNLDTGVETELYRFDSTKKRPYLDVEAKQNSFAFVSKEKVFCLKERSSSDTRSYLDLYVINMKSGVEKRLASSVYEMNVFDLWNGKKMIKYETIRSVGRELYYVFDDGTLYGKFRDEEFKNRPNKNFQVEPGKTLITGNVELFNNGKLMLMEKVTENTQNDVESEFNEEYFYIDQFIYLSNLKNKSKKLNLPNPSSIIGILPCSSKFIAKVAITALEIDASHTSLLKPAKMAYRLITLGRNK